MAITAHSGRRGWRNQLRNKSALASKFPKNDQFLKRMKKKTFNKCNWVTFAHIHRSWSFGWMRKSCETSDQSNTLAHTHTHTTLSIQSHSISLNIHFTCQLKKNSSHTFIPFIPINHSYVCVFYCELSGTSFLSFASGWRVKIVWVWMWMCG